MTKEYTLTSKPQRITVMSGMARTVVLQNEANIPCRFSDKEDAEGPSLRLYAGACLDLPLGPDTTLWAWLSPVHTGSVKITVLESRS